MDAPLPTYPKWPYGKSIKKTPFVQWVYSGFSSSLWESHPRPPAIYHTWVPWARCCHDFADILHATVARRFCQKTVGLWFQDNFFFGICLQPQFLFIDTKMMVWNLYLLLHVSRFGLKFQRCILDIMAAFKIIVMKFHPGEFEGDCPI